MAVYPWRFGKKDLAEIIRYAAEFHHGFWISSWEGLINSEGITLKDGPIALQDLARLIRQSWPGTTPQKD